MHVGSTSPAEEWVPIPGFNGKYDISRSGDIRRHDQVVTNVNGVTRTLRGGAVQPYVEAASGYLAVGLVGSEGARVRRLHRLLAEAFIPNPDGLRVVRHLNDIPGDNRLENLAWGTHRDNSLDCIRNGHHKTANLPACGKGHVYTEETTRYKSTGGRDCRVCLKLWRAARRDEINAQKRKRHAANRDRINAQRRATYTKD